MATGRSWHHRPEEASGRRPTLSIQIAGSDSPIKKAHTAPSVCPDSKSPTLTPPVLPARSASPQVHIPQALWARIYLNSILCHTSLPRVARTLVKCLSDSYSQVRVIAIDGFRYMKGPESSIAVPALLRALSYDQGQPFPRWSIGSQTRMRKPARLPPGLWAISRPCRNGPSGHW